MTSEITSRQDYCIVRAKLTSKNESFKEMVIHIYLGEDS